MTSTSVYGELREKWKPSRQQVLVVPCPSCHVGKNESCIRWSRRAKVMVDRKSNHMERVHAYLDLMERQT